MHTTVLRKVGGSVMMAVPPAILDLLDLAPGATVGVEVDDGRLVVTPERRPRYSLEELLAQCDASAPAPDEDHDWVAGKPAGDELL